MAAYAAAGKKLNMGKSCVRFRRADDAALDVIGEAVAQVTPDQLIAAHEAAHSPEAKQARRAKRAKRGGLTPRRCAVLPPPRPNPAA